MFVISIYWVFVYGKYIRSRKMLPNQVINGDLMVFLVVHKMKQQLFYANSVNESDSVNWK